MRSGKVNHKHIVNNEEKQVAAVAPRPFPRMTFDVLQEGQIRDLRGISAISLFALRHKNKVFAAAEKTLKSIMQTHLSKHNVRVHELAKDLTVFQQTTSMDLSYVYPIMQPANTNRHKLSSARNMLQHVISKLHNHVNVVDHRLKKQQERQRLHQKFNREKDHYEREIANRSSMQKILNQLTMPASFKQFMFEVNQLTAEEKQSLVRLTTVKESLSHKKEWVKTPYEVMFAYDPAQQDYTVGIRALYDHDHPHPTLLGGVDPVIRVAGTMDLTLSGETIKISKIRNDSGHFQPAAESIEEILRYIKLELNPAYYDALEVHSVDGDLQTPRMFI